MRDLTEEDYKKIIVRRDPRYDGRLYFGVTTTKIYCRPVCPARPKPENIVIYKSKTAAEKAGCRACLRCRPDLAPGNKYIQPGKDIVDRCLRLMEEATPEHKSIATLASTLDVSTRHLRRVFAEQLGASPVEVIQTQKIHFARHLLLETSEAISDIAFAAGFTSIRRFNEAFKATYRTTPSKIRQGKSTPEKENKGLTLTLMIRRPYAFDSVLSFLQRHAAQGIEEVTTRSYKRYVPCQNSYATLSISMNKQQNALLVNLTGFKLQQIRKVMVDVRRLFDTDHNPQHLPTISPIQHPGVRVPGCFDPFETAVSIILSQLVSISQATAKLAKLIQQFGKPLHTNKIFSFPTPKQLIKAEIETIGITRAKADAIRSVARMVSDKKLTFSYSADLQQTRKQLLAIKGIGPWTTEMIMMRCFGDADAFPKNDLFIKKALEKNLVNEEIWRTQRSYLTHSIWNACTKTTS